MGGPDTGRDTQQEKTRNRRNAAEESRAGAHLGQHDVLEGGAADLVDGVGEGLGGELVGLGDVELGHDGVGINVLHSGGGWVRVGGAGVGGVGKPVAEPNS